MISCDSPGLNSETYMRLRGQANYGLLSDNANWFKLSYTIFCESPAPRSKNDFLQLIAYTYSWMPTIPSVPDITDTEWQAIENYFTRLHKINDNDLANFLRLVVPVVNNSIVGTSKVLHFVAPNNLPIIDSRVVKVWNKEFGAIGNLNLGKNLSSRGRIDMVIKTYLDYKRHMSDWIKAMNDSVSLRELESTLYAQII
jgi:hypothetical protein